MADTSYLSATERSETGDESTNSPLPPPGTYGVTRPIFWGAGNIGSKMQNFSVAEEFHAKNKDLVDKSGLPVIPPSDAHKVANALPEHLRKEAFAKLASGESDAAAWAELAAKAATSALRESLPKIIEEAAKLAKK